MVNNDLDKKQSFKEYLKNRKNRMIIPAIILGVSFFSFYRLNMKQGEVKITNSMITASKIAQFANNEYIIRTNANDIYGFHRGANDYVIGSADIFLRDVNGNIVKPKEVKIYTEKDGKKTYFNVYNDRYDFELVLNGLESGEYTIYAEATGNNGKTYREKLWIGGHLRKNITVAGMQGEYRIDEGKIVVNKKETSYIIRTNTNDMYGFHRADGNDYVIGRADIFLSDNNGNRVKPNQVKIYAEKGGKQIPFNVYNDKYDYELLLNNIESGEYIIYAEATGNNGKIYKEKLWIGGHLRRNVTVAGMQAEAKVDEGKIIINRKEINYIIRTNTNDMYGFHRADGNDYIIGRADIFLSDNNGNRVKPNQVKIYAEKDGKQIPFNVYNDKYDYELLLNNIESGEYTIYAEATGNNGKTYKEKLWIGGHLRRNVTVAGMKTEVRVDEGKIIVKAQQKLQPQPILKLDKTNLNNKLKEVEGLVKGKELTEELKKDKTEDSIKKYNEEYIKVVAKLNTVKVNISKLGEDKTVENEGKLNQYILELENIKNNLNAFNNILKVKPQPVPKLDKTNLNNKLKEVEGLVKGKELTEALKKDKTEDSIKKYNEEYTKIVNNLNSVKINISKLGEEKTNENETKLNNYTKDLENVKNSLNTLNNILKIKPKPIPKLNKTNLNNKLKEVEELVKGKELTEVLKKDKTEDSIRKYNEEYIKVVAKLNTVKVNISKLGEDKTAENEGKLNQYISELENIKNSLSIFDNILKEKEVVVEKKVEFNNISSIKLFQNSPYGEAWVTILEEVPANVNDYFIKVESSNYRPIFLGVKKIEKVGNKYKIYAENDIEYILGENETRNKDITKVTGYNSSKANIYKNIFKLIPYYNLEKVIELGNRVDNSSVLNTKTISKVIPLKNKEVSSSEETKNGLANKAMVRYEDNTVEYYTLENLTKFKEFKEYNINISGVKVLYTPELGIENTKTKQIVDDIKGDYRAVKFYEDKKIWEILDPRIKALDKIKKRNEMKKQLGREVSEEELLRELQKITLEKMSYKDSFENVQKNIDDILNTLLINNRNVVSSNVSLDNVKKKLTDNKEKVLLGLTYIDRLYNLKYSNINLKNLIIYYPEFFGKKVDIIDFLIMLGSMNHIEYKLNATPETFRKKFNYIFKEQTIPEFLENNKNMFDPSLSINDWFKKSSNAYIVEQKSEYNGELDYLVYNKLKKNSEQKYLLPLLNVSENSIYVITTVTTTTFGLVDTYVDREGTTEERKAQLNEFENKLKETAKRQATFLDFWFRISNKDTHHNLISNRIVLDSLRIYNKNPYINARETWSKEYGDNVSKGISELIVPFDFYREFFVADGEANGLRSKYVSC